MHGTLVLRTYRRTSPLDQGSAIRIAFKISLSVATVRVEGQGVPLSELVMQLRQGGYCLVMPHASSPREAPSKERANPDNLKLERRLD